MTEETTRAEAAALSDKIHSQSFDADDFRRALDISAAYKPDYLPSTYLLAVDNAIREMNTLGFVSTAVTLDHLRGLLRKQWAEELGRVPEIVR